MASVSLRRLAKRYDPTGKAVLDDVSLEVHDGELFVLLGPSGSGKTTVLRCVAGLEQPSAGEILIGERDVTRLDPAARDVAMVFQTQALYPHLTVRSNIAFGLEVRHVAPADVERRVQQAADRLGLGAVLDRRVRQAADRLGLTGVLDRHPGELSGGERQRAALGRALVREPQVFLFDEPLSNLDAKLRVQMRVELKRLHERLETTAIYVTHDQVEAMTLGDRVVVMKDGWIQQVGEPLELYGKPANRFVAGFIGSPSMNFVEVTVADATGALWADTPGLRVKVPPAIAGRLGAYKGQRLTLGIRPEDLRVATGSDGADHSFDTVVEVVEPLGSEILLDLKAGPNVIVARVEPTVRVKHSDKMRLALHPERVHFFDNKTELAI